MKAALVVNPAATRVTPEVAAAVEAELAAAGPVETVLTNGPLDARRVVSELGGRVDRVYVLSGDGGVNEAVNGSDGAALLGFLPGGATNVAARALGLPRDPVAAARALAGSQRTRRIALGRAGERRFVFSAGLGLDAELVRAVDTLGRRRGTRPGDLTWARLLAGLLLRRRLRLEPSMTVGGRRAATVFVAKARPYTYAWGIGLPLAPDAAFELGLDVVAPERATPLSLPGLALGLARGKPGRRVLVLHDRDEVQVECDRPTALQADGEDLGDVEHVRFGVERDALDVLVP